MNLTNKEIKNIFKKLDSGLSEIQYKNNTNALIQISANFKSINEVIQYFQCSIDTTRTQNEALKEIIKETIREIIIIQEKMLNGIVPITELQEELKRITKKLKQPISIFTGFKEKIDKVISPKMIIIAIAGLVSVVLFAINPNFTKDFINVFTPIIKVTK